MFMRSKEGRVLFQLFYFSCESARLPRTGLPFVDKVQSPQWGPKAAEVREPSGQQKRPVASSFFQPDTALMMPNTLEWDVSLYRLLGWKWN